jgi:hypothetical protein
MRFSQEPERIRHRQRPGPVSDPELAEEACLDVFDGLRRNPEHAGGLPDRVSLGDGRQDLTFPRRQLGQIPAAGYPLVVPGVSSSDEGPHRKRADHEIALAHHAQHRHEVIIYFVGG